MEAAQSESLVTLNAQHVEAQLAVTIVDENINMETSGAGTNSPDEQLPDLNFEPNVCIHRKIVFRLFGFKV